VRQLGFAERQAEPELGLLKRHLEFAHTQARAAHSALQTASGGHNDGAAAALAATAASAADRAGRATQSYRRTPALRTS